MNVNRIPKKCSNANHICDKSQYNEASFFEKIKLMIHLAYCRACREYSANNASLTQLVKSPEVKTMDNTLKQDLKSRFAEELSKQQRN